MSYRNKKDPRVEMIANDLNNGKTVGVRGDYIDEILKGLSNLGIEVEVDSDEDDECGYTYLKLADNG